MSKQSDIVKVSQGAAGDPLFVDSANNSVGIGTSSPQYLGHFVDGDVAIVDTDATNNAEKQSLLFGGASGESAGLAGITGYRGASVNEGELIFKTNGGSGITERCRIDSSGNLLVGKTSANSDNAGFEANSTGFTAATRSNGTVFVMDRLVSDGTIIDFRSGNTAVGSIFSQGGGARIGIGNLDAGLLFNGSNDSIHVWNPSTNLPRDNAVDFGNSANRWDDIYATNGTIQTSDRNEKQDIAELTVAEITAAKAISKLFKTFKWNSSVEEKGEAARIHSGVIAQDVEQAMTDAGLDAGKYAFFISSTWWELDGQTYENAEEAPEGAVEKNRKGIRYPQLLSFVGAATEQRLASIESRLDALEDN